MSGTDVAVGLLVATAGPRRRPLDYCDLKSHTHVWRYSTDTSYGTIWCVCGRQSGRRTLDGHLDVRIDTVFDRPNTLVTPPDRS